MASLPPLINFYPRHPRGWRRSCNCINIFWAVISIHATLAGGDYFPLGSILVRPDISIHATLAGGDVQVGVCQLRPNLYFYPRHPRGWRQLEIIIYIYDRLFLSTPPSRVATASPGDLDGVVTISIHATLAGGDTGRPRHTGARALFLSTPPSRVATCQTVGAIIAR